MGKKKSWFSFVKRLFIPETKSKVEKKRNSWGWIFGGLKFKQYPEIAAPQKSLCEATEEQRKHVLAVAIATAAAAEAAVAAANAAAEVVKLTSISPDRKRKKNLAALRIQTAYRRHLAKKALNALKGLVKLQAVIRGELVRRKVIPKLNKNMQSAPNICHIRVPMADIDTIGCKRRQTPVNMIESHEFHLHDRNKSWDFSSVSKKEIEAFLFRRQEAVAKRERMKKYSYSHREKRNDQMLQESIKKEIGKQNSSRFNQVDVLEIGERERLKSSSSYIADDMNRMLQIRLSSTAIKQDSQELMPNSPYSLPRRSFCHIKQKSIGDDISLPNSPAFPTYMASTESAKAKARSISTPKQRLLLLSESSYAGQYSPCKFKISPWSSLNGDFSSSTSSSRKTVLPQSQQIYM